MDEEKQVKRRQTYSDRITLKPESLCRIDGWLEQLENQFKGIKISRTQLINWLVMERKVEFSRDEQANLQRAFFDDEMLGLWVIRELKERRGRGEQTSYLAVLAEATKGHLPKTRSPRPKRINRKELANCSEKSSEGDLANKK